MFDGHVGHELQIDTARHELIGIAQPAADASALQDDRQRVQVSVVQRLDHRGDGAAVVQQDGPGIGAEQGGGNAGELRQPFSRQDLPASRALGHIAARLRAGVAVRSAISQTTPFDTSGASVPRVVAMKSAVAPIVRQARSVVGSLSAI